MTVGVSRMERSKRIAPVGAAWRGILTVRPPPTVRPTLAMRHPCRHFEGGSATEKSLFTLDRMSRTFRAQ